MAENEKKIYGRCEGCSYLNIICGSGDWSFPACYHEPYEGKWTREIEVCPKSKESGIWKDI